MTAPTNHWKLGLFVVAAMLVGVLGVVYFGSRNLPKDRVTYVSYFDEAVTGLEVGATVKFRGVTVGNVSEIAVAPDRRHVQVSYDLASGSAQRLALDQASSEKARIGSVLRAQLGSMGVTGNKYVSLDLFDDADPPEPLSFTPPPRYIPTQPSTLKNLEAAVTDTAHRLPEVTEQLVTMLSRINGLLASLEEQQLPSRASQTLTHADQVLSTMHVKLQQIDAAGLSKQAQSTLSQLQDTTGRLSRLLERVDGESGLLANAERVSISMGDAARNARHVGGEAERTLREISEAAASVRELAEALERQPDMLLKGRARSSKP